MKSNEEICVWNNDYLNITLRIKDKKMSTETKEEAIDAALYLLKMFLEEKL